MYKSERNGNWRRSSNQYQKSKNINPSLITRHQRLLKPLASEEQKAKMQIADLSYDFACRITRLFQFLTEEQKEYILSKQIVRSGTSIGANVRESQHAQSTLDFISKLSIANKEADETDYWINLLNSSGYLNDIQSQSLLFDLTRIRKILTSIVKTASDKLKQNKQGNK